QRWRVTADRMRPPREDRQRQREVNWRRFQGSESRDELTIIPPALESVMTGSTVGRGGNAGTASARLNIREPILDGQEQGLESEDNSMDSNDGEYEGNGQSEEREESGEQHELDQDEDDEDQ